RIDVVAEGLVVEADVPADDRHGEGGAGLAHALDDLGELPHHLGVLGVAEVQAVDQGDGPGADARDVARRLEHGEPPAGAGGESAPAGRARGRSYRGPSPGLSTGTSASGSASAVPSPPPCSSNTPS